MALNKKKTELFNTVRKLKVKLSDAQQALTAGEVELEQRRRNKIGSMGSSASGLESEPAREAQARLTKLTEERKMFRADIKKRHEERAKLVAKVKELQKEVDELQCAQNSSNTKAQAGVSKGEKDKIALLNHKIDEKTKGQFILTAFAFPFSRVAFSRTRNRRGSIGFKSSFCESLS